MTKLADLSSTKYYGSLSTFQGVMSILQDKSMMDAMFQEISRTFVMDKGEKLKVIDVGSMTADVPIAQFSGQKDILAS